MSLERREFLRLAGLVAAGATVSACTPVYRLAAEAAEGPTPWIEGDGAIFRALNRMTYGPTLMERQHAASVGLGSWIEEQLAPWSLDDLWGDLAVRTLTSLTLQAADLAAWERDDVIAELQRGALLRRVHSRRQLFEVMVEFWTDHFNISVEKGECWLLKTVDDREVIRRHALGNFRRLLAASAHSPAMLVYLDNQVNHREAPNENYARELLELHTLGVDGGYGQQDVMEMARCLTGWTVKNRFWKGQFIFKPEMHDDGPKRVLGMEILPAGQAEAERVLDALALHPSTARRLARKLIRRFLDPIPERAQALIDRAAQAFLASDGEILPMLRVVLLDGVAAAPGQAVPAFKRPMHVVASALRMLDAETDGGELLQTHLARMGQPLFAWPTPDGPPDDPDAWQTGLLARWDFACDLARNEMKGTRVDLPRLAVVAGARDEGEAFDALANVLLGAPLAEPARSEVLRLAAPADAEESLALLAAGLLASPAFQWR